MTPPVEPKMSPALEPMPNGVSHSLSGSSAKLMPFVHKHRNKQRSHRGRRVMPIEPRSAQARKCSMGEERELCCGFRLTPFGHAHLLLEQRAQLRGGDDVADVARAVAARKPLAIRLACRYAGSTHEVLHPSLPVGPPSHQCKSFILTTEVRKMRCKHPGAEHSRAITLTHPSLAVQRVPCGTVNC